MMPMYLLYVLSSAKRIFDKSFLYDFCIAVWSNILYGKLLNLKNE